MCSGTIYNNNKTRSYRRGRQDVYKNILYIHVIIIIICTAADSDAMCRRRGGWGHRECAQCIYIGLLWERIPLGGRATNMQVHGRHTVATHTHASIPYNNNMVYTGAIRLHNALYRVCVFTRRDETKNKRVFGPGDSPARSKKKKNRATLSIPIPIMMIL